MYGEKVCEEEPVRAEQEYIFYTIEMKKVNNGFIVQVGCQTFVFDNKEKMYKYIDMYLTNPSDTEKAFRKGKLFND